MNNEELLLGFALVLGLLFLGARGTAASGKAIR